MFSQLAWLILSLILFGVWRFLKFVGQAKKIHGIYSQPTIFYWFKFHLIRFLVERQQKKRANSSEVYTGDLYRMNRKDKVKRFDPKLLEKKQKLPNDLPYAGDCIFFNGANKDGVYLALGFAQRQQDVANVFLVLRIPHIGTFVNEELLRTSNIKTQDDKEFYKTPSGFQIHCVEPMKRWHVQFKGNLVRAFELRQNLKQVGEDEPHSEDIQRFNCSFDWTWEASGKFIVKHYLTSLKQIYSGECFNFDTDVSPDLIAHSLALEPWTLEMFKKLESSHQTHYEQFGKLSGDLLIDGQKHDFQITSMRDHTIAPYRRWTDIRRYIMIVFHLEDGTCINSMAISMPDVVFSHLHFGYMIKPDGSKVPINRILNLQLPFIGENKTLSKSI
ncbi:hypothetical protein M3Y97_00904500 [Aphelenchoides bicaudatus]|nr:hypothetical protein M3Y97_00904500 [Aphelenchoides bicaudatus]